MGPKESSIILGTLGAPVGLKGWLSVQLNMQDPLQLPVYNACYIQLQDKRLPVQIEQVELRGKKWLLKLAGVDDRTAAEQYRLLPLCLPRNELPDLTPGEFYWSDLEGFAVWQGEQHLGQVQSLYQNVDLDVMIVSKGKERKHIPFVLDDIVQSVDMKTRKILVDCPADML